MDVNIKVSEEMLLILKTISENTNSDIKTNCINYTNWLHRNQYHKVALFHPHREEFWVSKNKEYERLTDDELYAKFCKEKID